MQAEFDAEGGPAPGMRPPGRRGPGEAAGVHGSPPGGEGAGRVPTLGAAAGRAKGGRAPRGRGPSELGAPKSRRRLTGRQPAWLCLRRMVAARNFLDAINGLALEMRHVTIPASRLGHSHFVEFMDACRGFLEGLDGGQRRLVLCASGLLSWTDECGDALAAAFDRNLACLNSGRDPDAEPDAGEYHEMFACTAIFVDAVRSLLPDIAEMAEGGRGAGRRRSGPESYRVDTDGAAGAAGARREAARRRAESEFPGMPWDSLLGAAGVRIEALGAGAPADGRREGVASKE